MARERILIVVKTYPVVSQRYVELSCTAGFREDGSWIRLYPIPFRLLEKGQRYSKYQWIEADIVKNTADPRPESYRLINADNIRVLNKIDTSDAWAERRKLVLEKRKIYTNRAEIVSLAHQNVVSLAVFKPTKIVDFAVEDAKPECRQDKIQSALNQLKQRNLFEGQNPDDFKFMPQIPKKFRYIFQDDAGKKIGLVIEDWEVGQLYLKCSKGDTPQRAAEKVKAKYLDDFARAKDLHFFLGTTRQWHTRHAPNPYIIIGTFHPPFAKQGRLL